MKNILKKITLLLLTAALFVPMLCVNVSCSTVNVVVNGETIDFTGDQAPFIDYASRTLVPLRRVFEKLGNDVAISWNAQEQMVIIAKGITVITLIIGNPYLTISEEDEVWYIEMDTTPTIVNGRTMLPARFVAEAIGATVSWNNGTVYINSNYTVVGGYVGDAQLSLVSRDGKLGCIDRSRKIVIPIEYDSIDFNEFSRTKNSAQADNFNNATYAIAKATKGGNVTYIGIVREHKDSYGNTVYPRLDFFDYAETVYARNNYVYVQKNGSWGIIDSAGNPAIPVEYQERPISITYHGTPLFLVKKNNLFGISTLDNGRLITDIEYNMIGMTDFTKAGNPVIYYQEGYICAMRNGIFGYIDTNGNELYPFNFQKVTPPENGKATVIFNGEERQIEFKNGSLSFINSSYDY